MVTKKNMINLYFKSKVSKSVIIPHFETSKTISLKAFYIVQAQLTKHHYFEI